jgi:hypothetical protein
MAIAQLSIKPLLMTLSHCAQYLFNGDICYTQHGIGGVWRPRYATSLLIFLVSLLISPLSILVPPPNWHEGRKHRKLADSSGPIFSMYLEMTEEEDKKMAEHWQEGFKLVIIVVHISVRLPYHFISSHINSYYSAVRSLPHLPHFLSSQSKTSRIYTVLSKCRTPFCQGTSTLRQNPSPAWFHWHYGS